MIEKHSKTSIGSGRPVRTLQRKPLCKAVEGRTQILRDQEVMAKYG